MSTHSQLSQHAVQLSAMEFRQPTASLIHLIGHLVLQQDRPTRWIKEAVHIRKEGHRTMNQDEGSYHLSHAYNFLDATADRHIKTQKN